MEDHLHDLVLCQDDALLLFLYVICVSCFFFFFQAEDGIRDGTVTGVQTYALPISYGRKRALELATTLATEPELMLLDEPTQGMAHEDVGRVVELIREVALGRTVLMVEHNLSVVEDLCDTITVLARGAVLAEGPYGEVARDPRVLEAYVGSVEN